ncbi:Hypothetical predicted protein [Lecanosticta acicola]|uniref:Low temperature requirement A n=1 Tax=Lecanosticta acicola TaxID=111012 RepID=A0AAI8Z8W3_9PEZI|nr:Hypothetical predicted protein [Lecanosticta acicola]
MVTNMSHGEYRSLPLLRSPLLGRQEPHKNRKDDEDLELKPLHESHDEANTQSVQDSAEFHRHAETTNAELFYDLFLVANFAVFTNVHEVNDGRALKQYVGFFTILWFTWYQVSLYDVRFAMDSVFERAARALQFMVMISLAIVGPKFDVGQRARPGNEGQAPSLPYFQALTIALMISRLVLVAQYLQAMWFTRGYKKTKLPMLLVASTYFAAAMVYLGLFWTFHQVNRKGGNISYITWYFVAILETIIATTVSSVWRNISFKGTHLVQRMSLLTLIILGEGVMGVAKKCQMIVKSDNGLEFSASTIGNVICAVLILYFIYMIYFDWLEDEHFGSIRQQIWSFLHFPLHVALVLAVEGVAQCITWRAAVERTDQLHDQYSLWQTLTPTSPASAFDDIANQINETATDIIYRGLYITNDLHETLEGFNNLANAFNATSIIANGTNDYPLSREAVDWVYFTLTKTIFSIAGFSAPDEDSAEAKLHETEVVDFADQHAAAEAAEATEKSANVFFLTYVRPKAYFFISIGIVVILCCLIAALSQRRKRWYHWIRLGLSTLVGFGLCLLTAMEAEGQGPGASFILSPWLLPTVTLCLLIVVVLNNVKQTHPDVIKGKKGRKEASAKG